MKARPMQSSGITIRSVEPRDAEAWERMRQTLWPSAAGEHAGEIAAYFGGKRDNPAEVLIAWDESGRALGFVELSIRREAEACYSGRVAYLEGWYVEPGSRRQGAGSALLHAAEDWGRSQGCAEMASDTEIGNAASEAAHKSHGFTETNRVVTFRKEL